MRTHAHLGIPLFRKTFVWTLECVACSRPGRSSLFCCRPRLYLSMGASPRFQLQLAGARVLRSVARMVDRTNDSATLEPLVRAMTRMLVETKGLGISAPQMGESMRVFMLPQPGREPLTVLNPRILRHSRSQLIGWEGCLSVPGFGGAVVRSERVAAEYETLTGDIIRRTFDGCGVTHPLCAQRLSLSSYTCLLMHGCACVCRAQ